VDWVFLKWINDVHLQASLKMKFFLTKIAFGKRFALMGWVFGACLTASDLLCAQATDYPNRAIALITPFPAAGSTDLVARTIAQKLAEVLARPIVVENHAGAGGNIGANIVAKAAPDGYTILITSSSTHSIGAILNKNVPFNYDSDFTPIVYGALAPNIFLVTKTLPAKNLKDFISFAKANPSVLNFSSAGTGTIMHLTGEAFKAEAGVQMMHIPYKGSGLSIPDLITGKVHVLFDSIVSGLSHVQDGNLTVLAVLAKNRSPLLPQTPTMREIGAPFGLKDFESVNWWGFYGPKNLPRDIQMKLNEGLNKVLKSKEVIDKLALLGAEPGGGSPESFQEFVLKDRAQWNKLIQSQKITLD
jgi:tripartite-type tricarboxylate transporter receptor subunit TctC